jgi:hypothetical protein
MIESRQSVRSDKSEITTLSLIARAILGGLLSAVLLTVFALLVSKGNPSATFSAQNIAIRLISGMIYVAIMIPLARRVAYRTLPRFLAMFVPLYVTGTLTDLIEAYFYTSLLKPFSLAVALIFEALPLLLITGIIAWLIPIGEHARHESGFGQVLRERGSLSWLWRIGIAGVPYPAIYLFFATLVRPLEHIYYSDPAFLATLHTVVPSTLTTLAVEVVRGVLFVVAVLPVIAVKRTSRWSTGLYIALVGAALEAWIPLLGRTDWPVMMRVGNVLELTADACGRALLMALLVALPSPRPVKTTMPLDQGSL